MKILVACEFSGIVRDAFLTRGHDAWSCDLLPTESPIVGRHIQGDVLDLLDADFGWDLLIAHPPCTYLTNAGVRHLHEHVASRTGVRAKVCGVARVEAMVEGCKFFSRFQDSGIPRICIENPLPHGYARELIGTYSQLIQPWHFGHEETKATCFWLKGLPKLEFTNVVGPPPRNMPIEQRRKWNRVHQMAPGKDRAKNRSRFFTGIAEAMAQQWGSILN